METEWMLNGLQAGITCGAPLVFFAVVISAVRKMVT